MFNVSNRQNPNVSRNVLVLKLGAFCKSKIVKDLGGHTVELEKSPKGL